MRRLEPLAAAALAACLMPAPARAGDAKKAQPAAPVGTVSNPPGPVLALPDFTVFFDTSGNVLVENKGDADYVGKLDVDVTCKVHPGGPAMATRAEPEPAGSLPHPVATCGSSFTNGLRHLTLDIGKGHGQAPQTGRTSGPGWAMQPLGLSKGSYELGAVVDPAGKIAEKSKANNTATQTLTVK